PTRRSSDLRDALATPLELVCDHPSEFRVATPTVCVAGVAGVALGASAEWGTVLNARAPLGIGEMNHRGERDQHQRRHHAAFACFAARTIARMASSTSITSVRWAKRKRAKFRNAPITAPPVSRTLRDRQYCTCGS